MAEGSQVRRWRPGWDLDVYDVIRVVRRGGRDPAFQRDADGTVWRAARTPHGTATLRVTTYRRDGEVELEAWGDGRAWALDRAPALLGADDDLSGFEPHDARVRAAWMRDRRWRMSRTGLVLEALVAAVLEQRVTGQEAWTGWRLMLQRFGDPAPGPGEQRGLRCLPTAQVLTQIPSWEWLRCQVDGSRSATVVRCASRSDSLERTLGLPAEAVDRRLRSIPGVGAWTSAEVRQRAHLDADAVSFGDYHVGRHLGLALLGHEATDDELAELLEPDRPHRYRIQHIVTTRMPGRARHWPRPAPRRHLPR
ncbi:MAG TPA: DNA-3-methyladenine glycosylase 2 family protein [Nocardioidaceae bacterium]|nr:DNA-3-methyladenine glycosylase 2 family protein [Nocardioidaceae bacterium]